MIHFKPNWHFPKWHYYYKKYLKNSKVIKGTRLHRMCIICNKKQVSNSIISSKTHNNWINE